MSIQLRCRSPLAIQKHLQPEFPAWVSPCELQKRVRKTELVPRSEAVDFVEPEAGEEVGHGRVLPDDKRSLRNVCEINEKPRCWSRFRVGVYPRGSLAVPLHQLFNLCRRESDHVIIDSATRLPACGLAGRRITDLKKTCFKKHSKRQGSESVGKSDRSMLR